MVSDADLPGKLLRGGTTCAPEVAV
jgi:hypothetical protein